MLQNCLSIRSAWPCMPWTHPYSHNSFFFLDSEPGSISGPSSAVAEEASQRRIDNYCEDTVIPWTVCKKLAEPGPGGNGDIELDEEFDLSPKPRS